MKSIAKLDCSGNACLCLGNCMTGLYYTYYCSPTLAQPFYIRMTITFLIIIPLILTPRFSTPEWRIVRGCSFGGLGALSLFPVMKALFHRRCTVDVFAVTSALIAMAIYEICAFTYVSRTNRVMLGWETRPLFGIASTNVYVLVARHCNTSVWLLSAAHARVGRLPGGIYCDVRSF